MSKSHRNGRIPDAAALGQAADSLVSAGAAVAAVRLPLNLISWLQMVRSEETDAVSPADDTLSVSEKVLEKAADYAAGKEVSEEAVLALREQNLALSRCLDAFSERFLLEEYMINRVEHRYSGRTLPADYTDAAEAEKITERLLAMQDASVRQSTVTAICGQFPVRLTRGRFFQMVADGIRMDEGQEKADVRNRIDLVRQTAVLEAPRGMESAFPRLAGILRQMDGSGAASWTASRYQEQADLLKRGMDELNGQMDLTLMLQEVIDDLCAAVLRPASEKTVALLRNILEHVVEPESLENLEGLDVLEGAEEEARMGFEKAGAVFDEFAEVYSAEICAAGLQDAYLTGRRVEFLLSDSAFADLPERFPAEHDAADRAYLDDEIGKLIPELIGTLQGSTKMRSRALMARVVSIFPKRFENLSELQKWMESSLASCSDEAEKLGCIEIIEGLL